MEKMDTEDMGVFEANGSLRYNMAITSTKNKFIELNQTPQCV